MSGWRRCRLQGIFPVFPCSGDPPPALVDGTNYRARMSSWSLPLNGTLRAHRDARKLQACKEART